MQSPESPHTSTVSGLCPRAIGIHSLNADCPDCCARHIMLTVSCLDLSCTRLCICAPDCLQLDHGFLCVSFGRGVHPCTAESLKKFNPFGILRLPLTVARDASDRPSADRSPLGIPTQLLRPLHIVTILEVRDRELFVIRGAPSHCTSTVQSD